MNTPDEVILLIALLSLGVSTLFYLKTNSSQKASQDKWRKRQQAVESEIGKLRGIVSELRIRLGDSDHGGMQGSPAQAPDSLNLNRRTQAIRLFRRGENPERVAELLTMPRQETALLWKVYKTISVPASIPESEVSVPNVSTLKDKSLLVERR